jgi:hypothetical protein
VRGIPYKLWSMDAKMGRGGEEGGLEDRKYEK